MSREKEAYRDNLEQLLLYFKEKRLLEPYEVAKYLGVCSKTVRKKFGFKNGYISIVNLARELS